MPHHKLVTSSCPRRSTTPPRSPATVSSRISHQYTPFALSHSREDFKYAVGTLDYRKQRNRKRTSTGEYVWTDEADIVFALALIAWTSVRGNRVGTRRAIFLQHYLTRYGFTKTRKQIASRLQVLKGEWSSSSYLNLLQDPDCPDVSPLHSSSPLPSQQSEQPPSSLQSAPIPSQTSAHGIDRKVDVPDESDPYRTAHLSPPFNYQHEPIEQAYPRSFEYRGQGNHSFPSFDAPIETIDRHFQPPAVASSYYTVAPPTMAPFPVTDFAMPYHNTPAYSEPSFHDKNMAASFGYPNHVSSSVRLSPYATHLDAYYQFSY